MTEEDLIDIHGRITAIELIVRGWMRTACETQPDPQEHLRASTEHNVALMRGMARGQGQEDHPIVASTEKWMRYMAQQIGTGMLLTGLDEHLNRAPAQVDRAGSRRKQ